MLEQWLCENSMSYPFQIGEACRQTGLTHMVEDGILKFSGESSHPLAKELLGKTFVVGTWTETETETEKEKKTDADNRPAKERTRERPVTGTEPSVAEEPVRD